MAKILLAVVPLIFCGATLAQVAKPPTQAPPPNQQIAPPLPQQPATQLPVIPARQILAVVVLDAAHGGADAGARGAAGINESDITLEYVRNLRPVLEAQGFRVVETRDDNSDPSFDDRAAIANGQRGAVFITLHVASTGTLGEVRVYSEAAEPAMPETGRAGATEPSGVAGALDASAAGQQAPTATPPINLTPTAFPARNGLLPWYRAQQSYAAASRRLAELVQAALAQKFAGTPANPFTAPIRQLRPIAAPAIAVEVSSVSVTSRSQLTQISHDLAEAIARGVAAFRPVYEESAR